MNTLHITNGDGAAGVLKASEISGEVLAWRDPMHHGPFPADLGLAGLRPIRAHHLAGEGFAIADVERDFRLRDEHLYAAPQYDHVLLWFEHDLLDQLQILQLLDWFCDVTLGATTLEMICIDQFRGVEEFRGIGQLDPKQMASLFDRRIPVTPEMKVLARAGWQAFRASDPRQMIRFCNDDLDGLPFMRDALNRHFEEFPSVSNGLTRSEAQLISLVTNGVHAPHELFLQNMAQESALYLGDRGTFSIIKDLCQAGLLSAGDAPFWYFAITPEDRTAFNEQRLAVTLQGQAALAGQVDHRSMHRDQWLGGVHLVSGQPHWAWDGNAKDFVWRGA